MIPYKRLVCLSILGGLLASCPSSESRSRSSRLVYGPGVHTIDGALVVDRPTVIVGAGMDVTTLRLESLDVLDSVELRDLTIEGAAVAVNLEPLERVASVRLVRVAFRGCADGVTWIRPRAGGQLSRLVLLNCEGSDLYRHFVEVAGPFDSVLVDGCHVDGCGNNAVRLGKNDESRQATWGPARIVGCDFRGVRAVADTNNAGGVVSFARRSIVASTTIDGVECGAATGSEAWGVYTKSAGAILQGLSISGISAPGDSRHAAGIRVKGDDRANDGATPHGYGVTVNGCNIDLRGAPRSVGIAISTDDVSVTGCNLEGFTWHGVELDADSLDRVTVSSSTILGANALSGVRLRSHGAGAVVSSLTIAGVAVPVRFTPRHAGASLVSVRGNVASGAEVGVSLNPGGAAGTVRVEGNDVHGDEAVEVLGAPIALPIVEGNSAN